MKKINKRIIILLALFIYKIVLDVGYVYFVHDKFEYMGFLLNVNWFKYLISIGSFLLIYVFVPKTSYKPSYIFIQLHLIIMIIPMLTIYSFTNQATEYFITIISLFILECVLVKRLPEVNIVRIKHSKFILYLVFGVISVYVYFSMIYYNGIPSLNALNLMNVYDIRSNIKYPFLTMYLVNWQAKVINPFMITLSYINRKWKYLAVSIFLQIVLFLIVPHKAYLFIPVAIIATMFLYERYQLFEVFSKTAALSSFTLVMIYIYTKSIWLPSLFIRRLLFVPALIKFHYYDFFSTNPKLFFSEGLIGSLLNLDYPYDMNSSNLMSAIYFNNPNSGANTGYIADAYANMGLLGMFFMTIMLVIIFKIIDSLSIKIGKGLVIGMAIFSIMSLNDSALLTTMLTGGLLFLIFVLYLYTNINNERR